MRQKLLNAHSITYVVVVFAANVIMTFAFNAIIVGWWHLFCSRHLITFCTYVAVITMAFTFGMVEIGK